MTLQIGVVMISGWSTRESIWDAVLKPLGEDFSCTHVNWWDGIANPEAAIREAAAEANNKIGKPAENPVLVMGWSLGGQIALQAADLVPHLISDLLLISTPVRLLVDEAGIGTDPTALRAMRLGLRKDADTVLKNFWGEATAGDATGLDITDVYYDIIADVDARTLDKGLGALADNDLRKRLPHIQTPTFIIQGDDDHIVGPQAAQQLTDGLPNTNAMILSGGSHALPLTHAHIIADILQALLSAQSGEAQA